MSFHFHPDAEAELHEAVRYYDDVKLGFGQDFAVEVYSAIQRAMAHPHAWMVLEGY